MTTVFYEKLTINSDLFIAAGWEQSLRLLFYQCFSSNYALVTFRMLREVRRRERTLSSSRLLGTDSLTEIS